jgi:hypothetical protein
MRRVAMNQEHQQAVVQALRAYRSAVIELRARVEDFLAQVAVCAAAAEELYAAYVRPPAPLESRHITGRVP